MKKAVELASRSTREQPRLLGGTPEEARAYLDKLAREDPAAKQACNDFSAKKRLSENGEKTHIRKQKKHIQKDIEST